MKKYYLSACVLIRVINPFMLAELLLYHRMMGVEHFYIFDNRSLYDLSYLLKGMNDVTLHIFDGEKGQENVLGSIYNFCLNQYRDETEYLVFIDDDEFINFTNEYESIPQVLRAFNEPDALMLNWFFMGCGSYRVRPFDKLLIDSNHYSANTFNNHTKGIYKTDKCKGFNSPHWGVFDKECRLVDGTGEAKEYFQGFNQLNSIPIIWEHHFFIQSFNEFRLKCDRGHVVAANKRKYDEEVQQNVEQSKFQNTMLERWVKKLAEMNVNSPMDALQVVSGDSSLSPLPVKYLTN